MKISSGRPKQRYYLPELTYGRPGLRIVLGRLLRGGGNIRTSLVGDLVCYEVPCTDEQFQAAVWCCGIDPAVTSREPMPIAPRNAPHRPYIRVDWRDAAGERCRIVRISDGAVMWTGYTSHVTRDGATLAPTRGPRLPEHTQWQPGEHACHPDWAALSWETRGAILASLAFLEVPPPIMPLSAENDYWADSRKTLAAALHG